MNYAVIGHTEWLTFARVDHLPVSGEILTAGESWSEAGGGGATAAAQLKRLGAEVGFFTALSGDYLGVRAGEQLRALGLKVHAAPWPGPQTSAFTYLEPNGERTITVIHRGPRPLAQHPLPWDALAGVRGVYFVKGDAEALRRARTAKVVVATARILPTLVEAGVQLDAVVHSAHDAGEVYRDGDLVPAPKLVVSTEGREGGTWQLATGEHGRYPPAPLAGPVVDTYGAGDSFAAGLTFGLGEGLPLAEALAVAARAGASALGRRGALGGAGN